MLTVVEDEQHLLVLELGDQDLHRSQGRLIPEVEGREDCVGHQSPVADLGQLDQPGAIGEPACKIGRGSQCESGLTHTPWPDETDEPARAELLSDLGELAPAADEARRLGGQIPQSVARPGHVADNGKPADYASNP